jgi:hypothetical protein
MALKSFLTLPVWLQVFNLFCAVQTSECLVNIKRSIFEEHSANFWKHLTEESCVRSKPGPKATHEVSASAENSAMFSKLLIAKFFPSDKPKKGVSRVIMDISLIANMSSITEWYNGNGSVEVQSGGVGSNYVVFGYDVPAGVGLYLETEIYSAEDYKKREGYERFNSDLSQDFATFLERRIKKKRQQKTEITFMAYGTYTGHKELRTEMYSFSFNKVIQHCIGESIWYNGKGSTKVTGGIGDRYFEFTSHIPAKVSGMNSYKCYFVKEMDLSMTVKKILPHSKVFGGDSQRNLGKEYVLNQIYDTILPGTDAIMWLFGNYSAGIISVKGRTEWKSGTGAMTLTEGGVGDKYIELTLNNSSHAYGSYQYNIMHLLAKVSAKAHCKSKELHTARYLGKFTIYRRYRVQNLSRTPLILTEVVCGFR